VFALIFIWEIDTNGNKKLYYLINL